MYTSRSYTEIARETKRVSDLEPDTHKSYTDIARETGNARDVIRDALNAPPHPDVR